MEQLPDDSEQLETPPAAATEQLSMPDDTEQLEAPSEAATGKLSDDPEQLEVPSEYATGKLSDDPEQLEVPSAAAGEQEAPRNVVFLEVPAVMDMDHLPEELVQLVLGLLDERTLRRSVPFVCRQWARLATTRGVWKNVKLAFEREADFAERVGWSPPSVLSLDLRRGGCPGSLSEDHWRTVLGCARHARRLTGLAVGGATPSSRRRLLELLERCWHSVEHVALRLEPPLDANSAPLWTLLSSMPRLTHLELTMPEAKAGAAWLNDEDGLPHELCWHWDVGWQRLQRLDLRGVPAAPTLWLLAGFLRVRGQDLREVILSPGVQLNPRLIRALNKCPRLEHLGVRCSRELWRLDALPQLTALTLLGLPRRDTASWILRSPLAARLERLSLDGLNPSLFDVLPAVGRGCRRLRCICFRRCQVPARFAQPLVGLQVREVRADNMRAEHVLEACRLPQLECLRLGGHLGNYNSMMVAVGQLRAAKPDVRVAGLEDGLFNNWGPGVHRTLAMSMLRPSGPSPVPAPCSPASPAPPASPASPPQPAPRFAPPSLTSAPRSP